MKRKGLGLVLILAMLIAHAMPAAASDFYEEEYVIQAVDNEIAFAEKQDLSDNTVSEDFMEMDFTSDAQEIAECEDFAATVYRLSEQNELDEYLQIFGENRTKAKNRSIALASAVKRNTVVSIAEAEVGESGVPNKYTYWYGELDGSYSYAWSHVFLSWVANMAGAWDILPDTAACVSGANWFKSKGRWKEASSEYSPLPGDIVYFDWNGDSIYDHVGIVKSASEGRLHTIEGNSGGAVKLDGGRVNGYDINSEWICGYGVPDYSEDETEIIPIPTPTGTPTPTPTFTPTPTPTLVPQIPEEINCSCSDRYAGYYRCTSITVPLKIRSGHGIEFEILGTIAPGTEMVYVSRSDGAWAHVTYNGVSGYSSMDYLEKMNYVEEPVILKVLQQPQDKEVQNAGEKVTLEVKADGKELSYKWFYKDRTSGTFTASTAVNQGNSYTTTVTESRDGRQIYCQITDESGNTVNTDVATLRIKREPVELKLLKPLEDVVVNLVGQSVKLTVEAQGNGLIYQWYYKDASATGFSASTAKQSSSYTTTVTRSRNGRQIYCQITDVNGNTIKTNVVTLRIQDTGLQIIGQPLNKIVNAAGRKAIVSVLAEGDGLKYQWYYKDTNSSKFKASTLANQGNSYTTTVTEARDGRQVYCQITDQYGASVSSQIVTISIQKEGRELKITKQPSGKIVKAGNKVTISVEAEGDGLIYHWLYRDAGKTAFSNSSVGSVTDYTFTVTAARNGRQVFCMVMDQYGNTVNTNIVTVIAQ